ncbi:MAG TPA: tyrosine-type recombinase/integrase [Acidimicrobiia bacterium]|nr:tyrosine-type recombinase/integrase [Acidimicrobiia bacterium]
MGNSLLGRCHRSSISADGPPWWLRRPSAWRSGRPPHLVARYSNPNRYCPRDNHRGQWEAAHRTAQDAGFGPNGGSSQFLAEDLAKHAAAKGRDDLLFTAPRGGMISPTTWRRRVWKPAVMLEGLEGVTFHSLRHSQGALLVEQGEHPLVVARRLGHTSVRTVLDVYGHLFEGIDQDAADRLDESVRNAGADQVRTKRRPKVIDLNVDREKTL